MRYAPCRRLRGNHRSHRRRATEPPSYDTAPYRRCASTFHPLSRSSPSTIHRSTPCLRPRPWCRNPIREALLRGLPSRLRYLRAKGPLSRAAVRPPPCRNPHVHNGPRSGAFWNRPARPAAGRKSPSRVLKIRPRSRPSDLWPIPSNNASRRCACCRPRSGSPYR